MRVLIRVDAAKEMGTGHLMRCLTLAEALRREACEVRFVCRDLPEPLSARLQRQGFDVTSLHDEPASGERGDLAHSHWLGVSQQQDAAATMRTLGQNGCDWVIVDHYALDHRWERAMRDRTERIMVIDDLADRDHDCDVLLDQNLLPDMQTRYVARVPQACTVLLGPKHALLQPEYEQLRGSVAPRRYPIKRVLIYFGGADREDLTGRTVALFTQPQLANIAVDAIVPSGSPHYECIARKCAAHANIRLHQHVSSLAPLMSTADLAIGACGATSWERLCLGLPSLVVTLAANQHGVAAEMQQQRLVRWLGNAADVSDAALESSLRAALDDQALREWSARCFDICDGQGTARAVSAIKAAADARHWNRSTRVVR